MPNNDKVELTEKIFVFFKNVARHPFLIFLLMLAFTVAAAGWIFFNFNQIYLDEPVANAPVIAEGGVVFDRAAADKYREVFSIMAEREKEYNVQDASTTVSQTQN